ncbi:hypothetical protein CHS0354_038225 [Potamilus streckersoni]|uniref:Riboflavin transporter n=1 Tax=Potamilus streckersoni TaxID=2493646 RepID=A0AAE0T0Q6_9BIVA|nr:hypothetical protein CHS0354_038225 [Potamilus streckersoni]
MACCRDVNILVYIIVCIFGIGSWIAVNGLWVELPILVDQLPEGWNLPSYMTIIIQIANIGPLVFTIANVLAPQKVKEKTVVYIIIIIGAAACMLLAFFWKETSHVFGSLHSTALLILQLFLALVDCTSSVVFLPFMAVFKPQYMTAYFIGEGFSGLLPSLVAFGQSVGQLECINVSVINTTTNQSEYQLKAHYLQPNFTVQDFFFFLFAMMVSSGIAFVLLNYLPWCKREHVQIQEFSEKEVSSDTFANSSYELEGRESNSTQQFIDPSSVPDERTYIRKGFKRQNLEINQDSYRVVNDYGVKQMSWKEYAYFLVLVGWINALTNGVLPSIQSYAEIPYGTNSYHLAVTLGNIANPVACFVTFLVPVKSTTILGMLSVLGTVISVYIISLAAYSPDPPLVGTIEGSILAVAAWVVIYLLLTFVKVTIATLFRFEGRKALLWCGAVTQVGSAIGAAVMFVIVNVYALFQQKYPCT